MRKHWRQFHQKPGWVRWLVKSSIFLVVVLLALYPRFWVLPEQWRRWADTNRVIDPRDPGLAELERAVRAEIDASTAPPNILELVQKKVYKRIPYAWDWDVWGVMDYLPTVREALEKGREDCDGRAVVAASLLRRMGYDAWLVSDVQHVWVETAIGETMSPSRRPKTLVTDATGTHSVRNFTAIQNMARGLTFGVAVFPWPRELLILAVFCGLAMHPWSPVWRRVLGCVLLGFSLVLFHMTEMPALTSKISQLTLAWSALGTALIGWLLLRIKTASRKLDPSPSIQ